MRRNKGFTIIELMIVVCILCILAAILCSSPKKPNTTQPEKPQDTNYIVRCMDGYKFATERFGGSAPVQILDAYGKGIPCN